MTFQHKNLAAGKWKTLSFCEQMANIGMEVERAISWKEKKNDGYSKMAFERALELLYLTIDACEKKESFKELTRLHEVLVDYFAGQNSFQSSPVAWRNYFYAFNFAARRDT